MKSLTKLLLVLFAFFLTSCKSTSDISIPELTSTNPYLETSSYKD